MSAKLANLGLLKIKVFWNKVYDAINFLHDVNRKFLSPDSSYIVDLVIWPTFYDSSTSMREVILTPFYKDLNGKGFFFQKCSWFSHSALKFYTSMKNRIKTKRNKVFRLILTFVEVTGGKLVRCVFLTPFPISW